MDKLNHFIFMVAMCLIMALCTSQTMAQKQAVRRMYSPTTEIKPKPSGSQKSTTRGKSTATHSSTDNDDDDDDVVEIKGTNAMNEEFTFNLSTGLLEYHDYCYQLRWVGGGKYVMGDKSAPEAEQQKVYLDGYYIGQCEVPQWLWQMVMIDNPSEIKGDLLPVTNVSWDDCDRFLKNLNMMLNTMFVLPTEAQWEFAALGGDAECTRLYSGSNNLDKAAWFNGNSSSPQISKSKKDNALQLYDMSGNVREWCFDWFSPYSTDPGVITNPAGHKHGEEKVVRGGSFRTSGEWCKVTTRDKLPNDISDNHTGFRLAYAWIR